MIMINDQQLTTDTHLLYNVKYVSVTKLAYA